MLYLWTNLPPNQRVGQEDLGEHHLIKVEDGQISYFVEKQYGVINGQVFYPSPTKNEYNLPPVVGSTDLLTVTKDSVYVKYSLDYGNRGVPKFELENYWERQDEIFNSNYYKPAQNIRETKNHLYFEFAGNRSEYHFTLLDKRTNSIQSIGKPSKRLNPAIIYSDAEYFYAYLIPAFIVNYVESGGDLSETTFFKDLDISKLEKYDNPVIVKFKLP
ncbi:hypothetical protein [Algoriphagus sp.]|uniref:hypothetical protein n=1 Tax=Algoriphagus sp. TaxID=1872435 RepID=UPI003F6EE4CC